MSRRAVLATTAAIGAASLAGCTGGDGGDSAGNPAAVTIPDDADCDVCKMIISKHPGPSSEVFYAENRPNDHDNPARFDSTWEAFQFDFEREDWTREAFYVTDYSTVEYTIRTDGGQKLISRHTDKSTFADAQSVTFVAGSSVIGTMGEDLLAFSKQSDAEAFQADHGGDLVTFDDVTPTLISQLGK